MPNEEEKALTRIVNGGLRSIAASFPVFASLGQAWSEYENYKTGNRISELMENLKIRFEELSTRVSMLEEFSGQIPEDFPSLLEIAIDKVRKEFSQEKRRIYANVLASLSIQQSAPYDDKCAILHSFDTLNPGDLDVLKLFKGTDESAAKDLDWHSLNLEGDDNQQLAELASMLAKLESRGLIVTIKLHTSVLVYPPENLDKSIARLSETQYRILPLGKKLLSTLE